LVTAVRLAVAFDLPVDGLEALVDRRGDVIDRLLGLQSVGDGDPLVLGEETG
jgi:hypothetical protein